MNEIHTLFEDFKTTDRVLNTSAAQAEAPTEDIESVKLEAFEKGYRAGWDDALETQSDDTHRISSAFGQNLLDLSFTYHEAHGRVMEAMTPLLNDMVNLLLPDMARLAFGPQIVSQLEQIAKQIGNLEVVIAVSPNSLAAVEPLMDADFRFPVSLVADDTLADGQADIRFGSSEKQIDLTNVLSAMRSAVDDFTEETRRRIANG